MEYLTSIEIAEKWNISSRRVTKLCNEGRIEGAELKGKTWLIPAKSKKPELHKRGRKSRNEE